MREEGHFNLVQLNRFNVPVDIQKKYGLFRGYPKSYKAAKQKLDTIPKEKRRVPYVSASRIVVLYPSDAAKDEVLQGLEFLLSDLKRRWAEDER